MEKQKKETRGRKPKGEKALTNTEKSRRQRIKKAFKIKAAEESGYIPTMVMLNKQHIAALREVEPSMGYGITQDKLDILIFMALEQFLDNHFKKCFEGNPDYMRVLEESPDYKKRLELVKNNLPEGASGLLTIQRNAIQKFKQWEEENE